MTRSALVVLAAMATTAAADVNVSQFARGGLDGWQERRFAHHTRYRVAEVNGRSVLDARATRSASGLYRRLEVDLAETPYLAWSWWVEAPVAVTDVHRREGDDFAARVYVVFSGGAFFWKTTTLVYVWADADAPAGPWPNPFTDRAAMFTVQRGGGGAWHDERRDVAADYRRAFGREPPPVAAVAIMTDTDQTGATAHARYADVRFSTGASALDPPPQSGQIGGTVEPDQGEQP